MSDRPDQKRVDLLAGVFVSVFVALVCVSLFIVASSKGLLETKVYVNVHFRSVSGLRGGSPVQLGGTRIGTVEEMNFIAPTYACNAATEDHGRFPERTDTCEPSLFCSSRGFCAELERYTGNPSAYEACANDDTCGDGSVCVTKAFRRRYRRSRWTGRDGWCVPFSTSHQRISVNMEVSEDKLRYIRDDSRATIAQNGVLGDQLINITVGTRNPVPDGGRIQATPSIMEEVGFIKERLEQATEKIGSALSGVAGLFDSLNDDRTKRDLRGIISNANEITRQIKDGEGLVGAMFNDPEYKQTFGETLLHVRDSVARVEAVATSVDKEAKPALAQATRAMSSAADILDALKDPQNESAVARALYDPKMGSSVASILDDTAKTVASASVVAKDAIETVRVIRNVVETGEGTIGKLLKDPKLYNDLAKILGNIERNNILKKFVRFVVQRDDENQSSARPATD